MSRFFEGFIAPRTSQKITLTLTGFWNPRGDWKNTFALAHPRDPNAELVCDAHSKVMIPGGVGGGFFRYSVTVTNVSSLPTFFDLDF